MVSLLTIPNCVVPRLTEIMIDDFTFDKNSTITHPTVISNIIPGDYTHDGLLDLLVMSPSGTKSNELDMTVYVALPSGGFGMCQVEPYVDK